MKPIKDILDRNIEKDIAPVVYFHRQEPESVEAEVCEYVITTRPARRGESGGGIHEQYVFLLNELARRLESGDCSSPGSWISGFFGSGKSIFAKLLGLSLDQMILPGNQRLADCLINRDDTPDAAAFRKAWDRLIALMDPLAVVFDIGTKSRQGEPIHTTVLRELQRRLGYSQYDSIANGEMLLEEENRYEEMKALCLEMYKKPWEEFKDQRIADQNFSYLYHRLYPAEYQTPTEWTDLNSGKRAMGILDMEQAVRDMKKIIARRAPGKTLFIVIDEVSQYIGDTPNLMLKLQCFVSHLGSEMNGKAWLLVTGQEKLDDIDRESVLWKLKDRFPPSLRVHLDRSNVREVVHRRLLKKNPLSIDALKQILDTPGVISKLKLNGYKCENVSPEAIIDHYPLLPEHIDLLLDITQAIRNRSSRVQADTGSVRGVLQIVWDLFNHEAVLFKVKHVGRLVTLADIYAILSPSMDSDILIAMEKIEKFCGNDTVTWNVAKAIALLEMIQEKEATTETLIARVLYPRLGADALSDDVAEAVKKLSSANLIIEQENLGWRIQDFAGQEWARKRDMLPVSSDSILEILENQLKRLMEEMESPRIQDTMLAWDVHNGDLDRISKSEYPAVPLIMWLETSQQTRDDSDHWVRLSREQAYLNFFIWVSGDHHTMFNTIREYERSRKMVEKFEHGKLDLPRTRLLMDERARMDRMSRELPEKIQECWINGMFIFRGLNRRARDLSRSFKQAVRMFAEDNLENLYPHFIEGKVNLSRDELEELFQTSIVSPNPKFGTRDGLGILTLDAGKVTFTPEGIVPSRILSFIQDKGGCKGATILDEFTRPGYGHPRNVIKACVIGLLRTENVFIQPMNAGKLQSYKDQGAKDTLIADASFRKCDVFPVEGGEETISPRDRVTCANFFHDKMNVEIDRDNEYIADAVYAQFDAWQTRAATIKYDLTAMGLNVPPILDQFIESLNACRKDRRVHPTVRSLLRNLDTLTEGVDKTVEIETYLTESTRNILKAFRTTLDRRWAQLKSIGVDSPLDAQAEIIGKHLSSDRPWKAYADALNAQSKIEDQYTRERNVLMDHHDRELEAAVIRVKSRRDIRDLTHDQIGSAVRLIERTALDTTETDTEPSLLQLRHAREVIRTAETRANELLDEMLPKKVPVDRITLSEYRNRTIQTEAELNAYLVELGDRIRDALKQGRHVRLV
jgi:hypothetical protein